MKVASTFFVSFLVSFVGSAFSARLNVTFDAPRWVEIRKGGEYRVNFSLCPDSGSVGNLVELRIVSSVDDAVQIAPDRFTYRDPARDSCNDSFVIRAEKIARTNVTLIGITRESTSLRSDSLHVRVVKDVRWLSYWFDVSVAVMVSLSYVHMGLTINLKTIRSILKRPVAPAVGFFCQFLVMPLSAYFAGQWLFDDDVLRIGLFVYGCCPGGGTTWTIILKGNYNLSITVSFINSIAALGLIPMWMLTLGKKLFKNKWTIPIENMVISLVSMMVPVVVGLVVQYLIPKIRKRALQLLLPLTLVMMVYLCLLGLFLYLDIFRMMTWQIASASLLNVCLGFVIAIIVSKLLTFSTEDTIAVAVDTGVQHAALALLLVSLSFPSIEESNWAKIVPITAYALTPCPLLLAFVVQRIYGALRKNRATTGDATDENTKLITTDKNGSESRSYSTFKG